MILLNRKRLIRGKVESDGDEGLKWSVTHSMFPSAGDSSCAETKGHLGNSSLEETVRDYRRYGEVLTGRNGLRARFGPILGAGGMGTV